MFLQKRPVLFLLNWSAEKHAGECLVRKFDRLLFHGNSQNETNLWHAQNSEKGTPRGSCRSEPKSTGDCSRVTGKQKFTFPRIFVL